MNGGDTEVWEAFYPNQQAILCQIKMVIQINKSLAQIKWIKSFLPSWFLFSYLFHLRNMEDTLTIKKILLSMNKPVISGHKNYGKLGFFYDVHYANNFCHFRYDKCLTQIKWIESFYLLMHSWLYIIPSREIKIYWP